MDKYTIGLDYGTLSLRGVLFNILNGDQVAVSVYEYPHKVMETSLPSGVKLGDSWALQDPRDYVDGMEYVIKELMKSSQVDKESVIGIGVDFTSCTILPTLKDGRPLCELEEFKDEPHSYVKLWKHHAAQYCANKLNTIAEERQETWLKLYGGKISSEWLFPKVMQIVEEAPEIYDAAERIIEAGDWLVWTLTGEETRSACQAGYKAMYHHEFGYPSKEFLKALNPRLEHIVEEKLDAPIISVGRKAGGLTEEMASRIGLLKGTAIASAVIDAHASVPACEIDSEGKMLMIMGTSTCHMLLSNTEEGVEGSCGIVKDGILPGTYGYEAGQSCVGDMFAWFVENCVSQEYYNNAKNENMNIHDYLTQKANTLRPGESGLLALDWWNGVRSDLMDFDLSGMILGMTLMTKPEELYRALIEGTGFGTKQIINCFEDANIKVRELYAAGGIAEKNPMAMQIYADVCNLPIRISASGQSGALGSAIYAIGAAGEDISGYKSVNEAAKKLGRLKDVIYTPIEENVQVYGKLFAEYVRLHDYFGKGENNVMKTLKKLKRMS